MNFKKVETRCWLLNENKNAHSQQVSSRTVILVAECYDIFESKMIAKTPSPPYFAVIFTTMRTDIEAGYTETAELMVRLAVQQEGFLGVESARNDIGITVSYWKDLESIRKWKLHTEHLHAQEKGKAQWYKHYKIRICLVERDYQFDKI